MNQLSINLATADAMPCEMPLSYSLQQHASGHSQLSTVVVTRPLKQALPLAERIKSLGVTPTVYPLLEISPAADRRLIHDAVGNLERYALVVFVSPNAIAAFFPYVTYWPRSTAIAVLGNSGTAQLERLGFTDAHVKILVPDPPSSNDSEGLARAIDMRQLRGKRVLIVRAETGREYLANAFLCTGVTVDLLAAYRRIPIKLDQQRMTTLNSLLTGANDWVITSSEGLTVLLDQAERAAGANGVRNLLSQRLIATHPRIVEAAKSLGFMHLLLSGTGDHAVMHCLTTLYSSRPDSS